MLGAGCVPLLAIGFGVAGFIVALFGFVLVRRFRLMGVLLICTGALMPLAVVALFVASFNAVRPYSGPGSAEFKGEFGFPPPHDVSDIRADSSGWSDSEVHYLAFRAKPDTIIELTKRFKLSDRGRCGETAKNPPAWFTPPTPVADCYVAEPFDKAFHTNRAWLTYDVNTGETRYFYRGVD